MELMREVTVTLQKRTSDAFVKIDLTAVKTPLRRMRSELAEQSYNVRFSDGTYLTPIGAQAMTFSSVGFALREANDVDYAITVRSLSGEISDVGDREVCILGGFVAAAYATGHQELVSDPSLEASLIALLDDWRIAEVRVKEVTD